MKRERLAQVVREVKYLCSKRQFEALVLLALTLIPDNKFVSRKFILLLLESEPSFKGDREISFRIMMTLSRLARNGLIERHSLMRYEDQEQLENFVQNSVLGHVETVGNRQTQSVFRLSDGGKKKLVAYLNGGILDGMLLTPEEKLLTVVFGGKE